mmetsp:Transcript_4893/g.14066  ORF Transcript_4893/g.14066 Transcript_4893/m.14066 type:complete len:206 (+) Transcript_4893:353-970(+)
MRACTPAPLSFSSPRIAGVRRTTLSCSRRRVCAAWYDFLRQNPCSFSATLSVSRKLVALARGLEKALASPAARTHVRSTIGRPDASATRLVKDLTKPADTSLLFARGCTTRCVKSASSSVTRPPSCLMIAVWAFLCTSPTLLANLTTTSGPALRRPSGKTSSATCAAAFAVLPDDLAGGACAAALLIPFLAGAPAFLVCFPLASG